MPDSALERHVIEAEAAKRKTLIAEVEAEVALLKRDLRQIKWVENANQADFWLSDLVLERDDPSFALLAKFGERQHPATAIHKACSMCLIDDLTQKFKVRRAFNELVEEQLFGEEGRLYRPLEMVSCERVKSRSRTDMVIAKVRPANSISLEAGLIYIVGHRIEGTWVQRSGVHLEVESIKPDRVTGHLKVLATGEPRDNFMKSCKSRPEFAIVLVPSLLPRLNGGTRN